LLDNQDKIAAKLEEAEQTLKLSNQDIAK